MVPEQDDTYLSVKTVAARLGVSGQTVRKLIESGELSSVRIGPKVIRISETALKAYLKEVAV